MPLVAVAGKPMTTQEPIRLFVAHAFAEHEDFHKGIVAKLEQLPASLQNAENAPTKQDALSILSSIFGNRVSDANLIKIIAAAPAFDAEPAQSTSPVKISTSMVSG